MAEDIKKIEDIFANIKKGMKLKEIDLAAYSPLTLAYIGDAVYELIIRTILVDRANKSVNKLHRESEGFVKAGTQARMIQSLLCVLTEEETAVYKRGRNAKSYTKAKHATYSDYRNATGFEALIGYLYLAQKSERMMELIQLALKNMEEERKIQ